MYALLYEYSKNNLYRIVLPLCILLDLVMKLKTVLCIWIPVSLTTSMFC